MKTQSLGRSISRHGSNRIRIPAVHEVTAVGLSIWARLPEKVKHDPVLASYRNEYERSRDADPNSHDADNVATDENNTPRPSLTQQEERIEIIPEEENEPEAKEESPSKYKIWLNYSKIAILLAVWAFFTAILIITDEENLPAIPMSVPENRTKIFPIPQTSQISEFELRLAGAFSTNLHGNTSDRLFVYVQVQTDNASDWMNIDQWSLPIADNEATNNFPIVQMDHIFYLNSKMAPINSTKYQSIRVAMETNINADFPFQFTYNGSPVDKNLGIIYAALILIGLYVLIIWEIVDKAFATILASTLCISVLAIMGSRPTLPKIIGWIDMETLFLLFGMMIIVGIMSETGLFDFLAVYAYKITSGKAWPLIYCLCIFTAILSAFLDNVTTLLLMAPVSIRLCEIMSLNPIPILTSMILYSNIGGALTPVGDPPNIIIISNSYVSKSGITFTNFILHMLLGVLLACLQAFLQLRLKYRTINDLRTSESREICELREEIRVWQQALSSISLYSNDDDFIRWTMVDKVKNLKKTLKKRLNSMCIPKESYTATLKELQEKYPIKNRPLLLKSSLSMVFVLGFFFLHSVPGLDRLSLGWIAFLGALLLLVLADLKDMDAVLSKIEWSTLIFFASLFVLIEALSELGLIDWIGDQTESLIVAVDEKWRLAVAILIIIWVSAVASSFLDNIPLTTMMIKITVSLAQNENLGLPLQPLIWALSFGACFGGNGTLIGASANIICAGVAEQHGLKMSFYQFFKIGFPMMIGNVLTATVYMMIAHVLLEWH